MFLNIPLILENHLLYIQNYNFEYDYSKLGNFTYKYLSLILNHTFKFGFMFHL